MAERATALAEKDLSQLLLDNLDFGLLALDAEFQVQHVNRKALEVLDADAKRLLGKPIGDLLLSRTPGYSFWGDAPPDLSEDPREVMLEFDGRELLLEVRWLSVTEKNAPVASILAFDDVTERVGELEFQRRVDRFASVGELSAVIAHEIRNPLTGIRTTIQYVGRKLDAKSSLKTDLDDAIKELDRIEQFTTDLLQFTSPKSLQLEEQGITPILSKVLDNLSLQFGESEITLRRDLAEDLPRIPLDADAIQQVFLNLILNAIDAMPDGGQLRVTTSSRRYRSRQAVEVAFHDTGCGIQEDNLDKIFDPFFTTRPNGTGLGLSISLQILREHGGRVNVRNRSQGGTTFRLSFPVPAGEKDGKSAEKQET